MAKKRWTVADIPDQTGRVAIVTGANSGIGYETAKALAAAGASVIVASRNDERGQQAVSGIQGVVEGASTEFMRLDLASLASVRAFAQAFKARGDRLDLLINNAGVMNPPERIETEDGFELQFGTNHLGHFALTLLLIDLLPKAPGSRVVNVSSTAQNFGKLDLEDPHWTRRRFHGMRSYAASKIANMLFTLELQRRLADAGVEAITTAAHPGWTATNLQDETPIARVLNPILAMEPWQGALPTLFAAVDQQVVPSGYYGPDGLWTMRGYPSPNTPAKQSTDADLAARLWSLSEELVGIDWPTIADSPATSHGA
ncbi:MAG: oxidoreductase [Gemmatimonadota bacterium]|nr:oxidoreductase [Gemmatimonadota bacterium]